MILEVDCGGLQCENCYALVMMWLMEEHKEPAVDWGGDVEIETILGGFTLLERIKEFEKQEEVKND